MYVLVLVTHLCPTLCDPMDCSPPCSSVHGISQARILEWVAISYSSEYFRPRNRTWVSCICDGRQILYYSATWEAQCMYMHIYVCVCVCGCISHTCVCMYVYTYNPTSILPFLLTTIGTWPCFHDLSRGENQGLLYYFYSWSNTALPYTVARGTSSNHFPIQNSRMAQIHMWHDGPPSAPRLSDHTSDHAPSSLWPHPSWTWSSPPRSVHCGVFPPLGCAGPRSLLHLFLLPLVVFPHHSRQPRSCPGAQGSDED